MKLNGAHIVCESLVRLGVDTIFGIPGGTVLDLYDVLPQYPQLRHVLVRHEQAAAFAADAYSRATGRVGVALVTSGPGATNTVTGIANAMMDSSGFVVITGNVSQQLMGSDAFQECDITGVTLPITKHNYVVERVDHLARTIKEAFHIAGTGRRGPVLIDIPRNLFGEEVEFEWPQKVDLPGYRPTRQGHPRQIKQAAEVINSAKRPVIIAGHGVICSQAYSQLRQLAEKADIPVIWTLMGASAFPRSHRLDVGMPGMHGMAYSNHAITNSDVLIGIGLRFDDRVTQKVSAFAPHAKIVHIDIDPAEIGKNVKTYVPIVGDVAPVLDYLLPLVEESCHREWIEQIEHWKREHPLITPRAQTPLQTPYIIKLLSDLTGGEASIVTDVGQHQMWVAQYYWFNRSNTMFTAGGLGSMGFGLPAAMGVAAARPDEDVWAVLGDGGFMMTMQELATIAENNFRVKILVVNNNSLGMVHQWQTIIYKNNIVHSDFQRHPDFVKLGEAFGIPTFRTTTPEEYESALRRAEEIPGPAMIEAVTVASENVYPMVRRGHGIAEMIEA
ncbi:MAG: biosynthetic-type acetolactate synthase large subunit [Chloroflexi bacterium]|nr:biosynthetic-type acetolactate synthase large subunit [Chloroflexota bacterium]